MDISQRKIVRVGGLNFGDGNVFVQSMLNAGADDVNANIAQAQRLIEAGCEVIRVAVPTVDDVGLIYALKEAVTPPKNRANPIPIVADIHFDYRIAVEAVRAGADKIRINPGNIGDNDRVKAVVNACKTAGIPIRVGVNSGSVKTDKSGKAGKADKNGINCISGIVQSALDNIKLLEGFDFDDIIVSVKSSNVVETIAAYRELARLTRYPLHLGVTEAGTRRMGIVKSAVGIGSLLCDGIGDTIRVSLTAEPEREVEAAFDILSACGRRKGVEIISCPTCGRCKIDVVSLAEKVEVLTRGINKPVKIAVMGCAVNGPGECKDADFGITGGDGVGLVFRHGEIVKKVHESELLNALNEQLTNS